MIEDEPVQRIDEKNYKLQITNYKQIPNSKFQITNIIENFIQPFDLSKAPLLRVGLIKEAENRHILLMDMHHIITDGWSMELLEREFQKLYEANRKARNNDLIPLKIQYKDYADWHNRLLSEKSRLADARAFWTRQLQGKIPVLNLPHSFEIESPDNYQSAAYRTVIQGELIDLLRTIAADNRGSLFMVLLAAFNVFLFRITGQRDILVGVPGAARHPGIGCSDRSPNTLGAG